MGARGGHSPHPVTRPRVGRLTFECRGVEIAGQVHRAATCSVQCELTEAQARQRVDQATRPGHAATSLRLAEQTYVCRHCAGLRRIVDMARAAVDATSQPWADDALADRLDQLGFLRRPPRTLAEARRVMREVGFTTADTLASPDKIDTQARASKRVAKQRRRRDRVARGIQSSAVDERRIDRVTAGKWRSGVRIVVTFCGGCGKLLFADECGPLVTSKYSVNPVTVTGV